MPVGPNSEVQGSNSHVIDTCYINYERGHLSEFRKYQNIFIAWPYCVVTFDYLVSLITKLLGFNWQHIMLKFECICCNDYHSVLIFTAAVLEHVPALSCPWPVICVEPDGGDRMSFRGYISSVQNAGWLLNTWPDSRKSQSHDWGVLVSWTVHDLLSSYNFLEEK